MEHRADWKPNINQTVNTFMTNNEKNYRSDLYEMKRRFKKCSPFQTIKKLDTKFKVRSRHPLWSGKLSNVDRLDLSLIRDAKRLGFENEFRIRGV